MATVKIQKSVLSNAVRKKLEVTAAKVMKKAHAPYSKFRVGAAILADQRKDLLWLQRGECVLRNDQLRGAHGNFFGRRGTRAQRWRFGQSR